MQFMMQNKILIFVIILFFITILIVPNYLNTIKISGYKVLRNLYKSQIDYATSEFAEVTKDRFVFKYKDVKYPSVELVAETANEVVDPVNNFFNFSPQQDIPIIIYPSMESLNASFGWDGDKSPMGVYWMGTIRVLAPEIWIEEKDTEKQEQIFKATGPMAHEYAHLVVDYKTNGNYTRWFTEGVAQYAEKKLTGFTLEEPFDAAKLNIYPFAKLDGQFDDQLNQELAYWQSLLALEYLVEKHDESIINDILDLLAQGRTLNSTLYELTGDDLESFEKNIRVYAQTKVNTN